MSAAASLGRVTVFTCFHLVLNEAATLNYACCGDNPIKKGGKEWKDTQADTQELFGRCLLESCMYDGVRPPLSPHLNRKADLESIHGDLQQQHKRVYVYTPALSTLLLE